MNYNQGTYNSSNMGGFSNFTSNIGGYSENLHSNTGGNTSESGTKKPKNTSIRHVTIKQIKSIPVPEDRDAPLILDNQEISQIVLVAGLSSPPDAQTTCFVLNVEDGTGFLEVRAWGSADSDNASLVAKQCEMIKPHTYIQIIGQLKVLNGRVNVSTFHVRQITDPNEITAHFLECIHTHFSLSRPRKTNSSLNPGYGQYQSHHQPGISQTSHNVDPALASKLDFRRSILHFLNLNVASGNVPLSNIYNTFANGQHTNSEVDAALEWLSYEGHIFGDHTGYKAAVKNF